MKRSAAMWLKMADWAEQKAAENSTSDKPWALRNVRMYQDKMSEWLGEHYKAAREEATP